MTSDDAVISGGKLRGEIPPPSEHGDDAGRVAAALGLKDSEMLDLAISLNPLAPELRLLVASGLGALRSYPDAREGSSLLAAAMGVRSERLLLTNGGSEAIALVAAELGEGDVVEPEFSLYRRHLGVVRAGAGRWRSNPNNPTGRLLSDREGARVIDEAFFPLATGRWTRGDSESSDTIVVGSLTKVFSCPGLRLGYVLCRDAELMESVRARQPQWSVSSIALAALPKMLELARLESWRDGIASLRGSLIALLRRHDLEPEPSDANFLLVRQATGLREVLARRGVLVRDCSSFGLAGAVRIAVPSEAGLDRLERVLGQSRVVRPSVQDNRAPARALDAARGGGGALLVTGTASDAGKSMFVAGLCRLLARDGVRVAPFKAQNMSLNSYPTPSGHEIGRAQAMQAMAACVTPEVAMNPILLKPTGEQTSQIVVMGEPLAEMDARGYQATRRASLMPIVLGALEDLRQRFEVVICEGAGSPAEINLLDSDLANLNLAHASGIEAVLVGDIDRGGVFASIAGTFAVLPDHLSRHLSAFVINKIRGDSSLLTEGIRQLESLTGRPCAGVVPFIDGLHLDAEDSMGLDRLIRASSVPSPDRLDVAVIALPRLSNFTDLDALAIEDSLSLRLVSEPRALGDPDLVLILGSKSTVTDLDWLISTGLAAAITQASCRPDGPTIFGVCAGYQMLGERIVDDYESRRGPVAGMGLLKVATTFFPNKRTLYREGRTAYGEIRGYEIRQGNPEHLRGSCDKTFADLDDVHGKSEEGVVRGDGRVIGTNLHGLFETDAFRVAVLSELGARRQKSFVPSGRLFEVERQAQIDRYADVLAANVDVDLLMELASKAKGARR